MFSRLPLGTLRRASFAALLHTTSPRSGRLVLNHSSNVEGLVDVLKDLARSPLVSAVIPARLARGGGRSSQLDLRVSVPTPTGWKVLATKGAMIQEVFVVSNLSCGDLQRELDARSPAGRSARAR